MSSPILSQKVAKSQRYEEVQQLYDLILDEEEGIQRRQARRKRERTTLRAQTKAPMTISMTTISLRPLLKMT